MTTQPEREGIEESIRHFCNAFAMTMPPSNEMMQATRNLRNQLPSFLHQELQKAREGERDRVNKILAGHGKGCDPRYHAECIEMIYEDVNQSELD